MNAERGMRNPEQGTTRNYRQAAAAAAARGNVIARSLGVLHGRCYWKPRRYGVPAHLPVSCGPPVAGGLEDPCDFAPGT